ncbi:uncharacterized protein EI90DRAFT_3037909 [Cantharellus anzutake]|uniref:uncharacterized protein n=1 Tax=Cantharellus anzutake TaxID=1750568 RepID=UPI001903CB95|nr:uncharacterized protein EI90DRAFT_3037909 [Cantharellus anzutake]KAF8339828.1 hypothetical protein EI90DRAFT_3037909 [Cantharellus anzutake]
MMQHLYQTAIFWGDKVFSWTSDPNDAFWLAQAHFLCHQYQRAEAILTNQYAFEMPRATTTKGKERDGLLRGNMPLMGGVNIIPQKAGTYSRLVDLSAPCRYLAAQCSVRLGKWDEALEMLGEVNPFRGREDEPPPFLIPDAQGGTKVESTMCFLRGVILLRIGRAEDAKESLMEALAIDYKNVDAFEQLIGGEMMKIDEEWEFIQSLQFHGEDPFCTEFVRSIYTVRLRKFKHQHEIALARHKLSTDYRLADNVDVLFSFADSLFAQYRYADCFAITSRILEKTRIHGPTIPIHIACMQHIPNLRSKLFLLAHELMQKEPEAPISSYAVAIWYLFTKKYALSRRWISKTTLLDPRNAPAWIAFAHTFAFEGEHDQAVTAYSTCARLFRGTHLPSLYIGMEHLRMMNLPLAQEYLEGAYDLCDSDPLLLNEMGVLASHQNQTQRAVEMFEKALELADASQTSKQAWLGTYLNLGQAHRKLKNYSQAKAAYEEVIRIDPRNPQGLACLGIIHHALGELGDAITKYHEALSVQPLDANVIELLNLALKLNTVINPFSSTPSADTDAHSFTRPPLGSSDPPPPSKPISAVEQDLAIIQSIRTASVPRPATTRGGPIIGAEWVPSMGARHHAFNGRTEQPPARVEDSGPGNRHLAIMENPGIPPPGGIPGRESRDVEEAIEMSIEESSELVDASMELE